MQNFDEILEGSHCVSCGCTDKAKFQPYYPLIHKNDTDFYLFQCQACDFVFLPPYYRQFIDYTNYKGDSVLAQIRQGNNWLKVQRQKLKFDLISKYKPQGKLMDLGCGWGHFLLAAKELGYDIYGIEIAKSLHEYCTKDLKLPVEDVNLFDMPDQARFDLITMWDVLEHIDAADAFLEKCHTLLKPGGFVFIQVPAIDSYLSRKKKEDWAMISLDHVNYFSRKTVTQLFERKGFKVREIKSSLELKIFLLYVVLPWLKRRKAPKNAQDQAVQIHAAERQQYFNQVTARPMWQLKLMVSAHNLMYRLLSALNIGEEMVVVAEKV